MEEGLFTVSGLTAISVGSDEGGVVGRPGMTREEAGMNEGTSRRAARRFLHLFGEGMAPAASSRAPTGMASHGGKHLAGPSDAAAMRAHEPDLPRRSLLHEAWQPACDAATGRLCRCRGRVRANRPAADHHVAAVAAGSLPSARVKWADPGSARAKPQAEPTMPTGATARSLVSMASQSAFGTWPVAKSLPNRLSACCPRRFEHDHGYMVEHDLARQAVERQGA